MAETPWSTLVARGSAALLVRQLLTFVVMFGGSIALARLLQPGEMGLYALLILVAGLAKVIVDAGLSATLVHQGTSPTDAEIDTVVTTQLLMAAGAFIVFQLSAPLIGGLYSEVPGATSAVRLAGVAFLAIPFLAVPTALLEREMRFGAVGLILLVQPLVLTAVAVGLVVAGVGAAALGVATAASVWASVPVGLRLLDRRPRLAFDRQILEGRFRFGLPMSATNWISMVKDAVNPLFIGALLGPAAVGYVNWAQQFAVAASYFLFVLARVYFPLFARLRDSPERLAWAIGRASLWSHALVAPVTLFILVEAEGITTLLFGERWLPAVPTLRLLLAANLLAPTYAIFLAVLNAHGRTRTPLLYSIVWFVGTWVLVPALTSATGFVGYGIANIGVTLLGLPLLATARRYVSLAAIARSMLAWPIALVAVLIADRVARLMPVSAANETAIALPVAASLFLVGFYALGRRYVHEAWRVIRQ